jgi:hypothetical protein
VVVNVLIPELADEDLKFEDSLGYIVISKTAWATGQDPVPKKTQKRNP